MRHGYAGVWKRMLENSRGCFLESLHGRTRYAQLTDLIRRCCAEFDRVGMAAGDRLLIVSSNDAVASAYFVAALLDGKVPVMLSAESRSPRVAAACSSVEPKLLVVDESRLDTLARVSNAAFQTIPDNFESHAASRSDRGVAHRLLRQFRPERQAQELGLPQQGREPQLPPVDASLAYILFTSGTTSNPSGVQLSRHSLLAHLDTQKRLFGYNAASRIFNATPLAHTDGLVQGLMLAVVNAAALVRPGPFVIAELEPWLDFLTRMQATHFITNPTMLNMISQLAQHDDYFEHPDFFGVLCSASPLRNELWETFESRFGCDIYNLYGMTETVANATYAGRHPEMGPIGSMGVPIDCEVRLVPPQGSEPQQTASSSQQANEGEVQIRGENVFLGYWKDPERTSRTFTADGWMRTGDLARWQADGGLQFIGRIKSIINVGGLSILPAEIDEALLEHASVTEAVTVGMADENFEEVPVTAVKLNRQIGEQELTEFCRANLEPLKVPRRIIAVPEIPRGGAGKPQATALRELLKSRLSTGKMVEADRTTLTQQAVLTMAAGVFRVPVSSLVPESTPDTVEGWDSFTQLSLIIAAEAHFGRRVGAADVAGVRTLADLYQALSKPQS